MCSVRAGAGVAAVWTGCAAGTGVAGGTATGAGLGTMVGDMATGADSVRVVAGVAATRAGAGEVAWDGAPAFAVETGATCGVDWGLASAIGVEAGVGLGAVEVAFGVAAGVVADAPDAGGVAVADRRCGTASAAGLLSAGLAAAFGAEVGAFVTALPRLSASSSS